MEEKAATIKASETKAIADDAQRDLDLALPALEEALGADDEGLVLEGRVLPPGCAGCLHDSVCAGVDVSWWRDSGEEELVPTLPDDGATIHWGDEGGPRPRGGWR